MQVDLNIKREKNNVLELNKYEDPYCFLQFHSQIEIFGVLEGEMEMLVDGKRQLVKAGEFSVVLPYSAHEYKTPTCSKTFQAIIPAFLCTEFMSTIKGKRLKNPFFSDPKLFNDVKELFELMSEENASEIRKLGIVNLILGYILEKGDFINSETNSNLELIHKILLYINENFKANISPNQIAKEFGYSLAYISHQFKIQCYISLKRYIALVRLKNAVSLMQNKNNSITYCAYESGFTSIRTFYRSFQNEFGCSPKAYIEKL